jgi:hypothetical protein
MATTFEVRVGQKRLTAVRVTVPGPDGPRDVWEFTCTPWPRIAAKFQHAADTDGAYWAFLDHVLGKATWAFEGRGAAGRKTA